MTTQSRWSKFTPVLIGGQGGLLLLWGALCVVSFITETHAVTYEAATGQSTQPPTLNLYVGIVLLVFAAVVLAAGVGVARARKQNSTHPAWPKLTIAIVFAQSGVWLALFLVQFVSTASSLASEPHECIDMVGNSYQTVPCTWQSDLLSSVGGLAGIVALLAPLVLGVAGVGLLRHRRWAWLLAIALENVAFLTLAWVLYSLAQEPSDYFSVGEAEGDLMFTVAWMASMGLALYMLTTSRNQLAESEKNILAVTTEA